jgi:hypothetical protein
MTDGAEAGLDHIGEGADGGFHGLIGRDIIAGHECLFGSDHIGFRGHVFGVGADPQVDDEPDRADGEGPDGIHAPPAFLEDLDEGLFDFNGLLGICTKGDHGQ